MCRTQPQRFFLLVTLATIIYVINIRLWEHLDRGQDRKSGQGFDSDQVQARIREKIMDQAICTPVHNVGFVKIHKTASGSFHNQLSRIALENSLVIALPKCWSHSGNFHVFPATPQARFLYPHPVSNTPFRGYNMFLDHAVFDKDALREFLPADLKFVTQLRHPYPQSRSLFHHWHIHHNFPTNDFDAFMVDPTNISSSVAGCYAPKTQVSVSRNFQAFTLGYTKASGNNLSDFESFLQHLDRTLDFVSILELKEESQVLLKRKFCWHMKDILYLRTHKTIDGSPQVTDIQPELLEKHKQWSALDYSMYDHFKTKLLDDIQAQSNDFADELIEYRRLNDIFSQFCHDMCYSFRGISPGNISYIREKLNYYISIPQSSFSPAFMISYTDCLLAMAQEKSLKDVHKFSQYSKAACSNNTLMEEYGLSEWLCSDSQHVYPGFHIKHFRSKVLETDNCVTLRYID